MSAETWQVQYRSAGSDEFWQNGTSPHYTEAEAMSYAKSATQQRRAVALEFRVIRRAPDEVIWTSEPEPEELPTVGILGRWNLVGTVRCPACPAYKILGMIEESSPTDGPHTWTCAEHGEFIVRLHSGEPWAEDAAEDAAKAEEETDEELTQADYNDGYADGARGRGRDFSRGNAYRAGYDKGQGRPPGQGAKRREDEREAKDSPGADDPPHYEEQIAQAHAQQVYADARAKERTEADHSAGYLAWKKSRQEIEENQRKPGENRATYCASWDGWSDQSDQSDQSGE